MSIYSGFATRQLESQYNTLLQLLLLTLSKRIVKTYKQEDCNEKAFRGVFYRIMGGLKALENSEHVKLLFDTLQIVDVQDNDRHQASIMLKSNGFEEINKEAILLLTPKRGTSQEQNKKLNFQFQRLQPLNESRGRERGYQGMPPYPTNDEVNRSHVISLEPRADQEKKGVPQSSLPENQHIQTDLNPGTTGLEEKLTLLQPIQIKSKIKYSGTTYTEHGSDTKTNNPHYQPSATNQNFYPSSKDDSINKSNRDPSVQTNKQSVTKGEQNEFEKPLEPLLPYIGQQINLTQDLVDRITQNVELQVLNKLRKQNENGIKQKKNKSKNKKSKPKQRLNNQLPFKQLLKEFDPPNDIVNQTFYQSTQPSRNQCKTNYIFNSNLESLLLQPVSQRGNGLVSSEGTKNRPKFYSVK